MKIIKNGEAKVIMSNPLSRFNYFAWPTAVRLKNGKIAVGASGMRLGHLCPFGKAMLAYSEDEGETYSLPSAITDTPLDDRDVGFCPFGESGLILTSFTETLKIQADYAEKHYEDKNCFEYKIVKAYLEKLDREPTKGHTSVLTTG